MAPKGKPKAGAAGSAANAVPRRSSDAPASKAKAKAKGKGKTDSKPERSPEDLAVMVWQGASRGFLAQLLLAELLAKRKEQDAEMAKNLREANAAAMAVDRKREEAQRQKEAEKRQKIKQLKEDTKKMLQHAFDGEETGLQSLLDKGLRVNAADHLGTTAISEAATGGRTDAAILLLEKKANPNSQGEFKRTALWRAAYASHGDMIRLLLEAGGDPRLTDDSGQKPLDVATQDDVAEMLREWDVEKTDVLVEDYQSWLDETRAEEEFRQKQAMQSVESEYQAAKKAYEATQMLRAKAKSQMRNREEEYAGAAKDQRAYDSCASADEALQRADADAFAAQMRFDKANLARMAAAELHAVQGTLPGREVLVTDLNNVLVRDLGERTRDGTQWTLVIDPNDCAKKLMFYSGSVVLGFFKAAEMEPDRLRVALLTMIRAGGTLAIDLVCFGGGVDMALLSEPFERIRPGLFGELCNRSLLKMPKGSVMHDFHKLITKDEKKEKFRFELFDDEHIASFKFVVLTCTEHPQQELMDAFDIIRVSALQ